MLDRVAPNVKVNQDDAGMKLAFKEWARPSSQWMRRTAVEEGGKATGLYSSASSSRTPEDTSSSVGPGCWEDRYVDVRMEDGMREEKQSLEDCRESRTLCATYKGWRDPLREDLRYLGIYINI